MNIIRYICAIAFAAIVSSCSLAEFDVPVNDAINDSAIQVVGRVIPFIEQNVDTRAEGKNFDESSTYSMCLAVFGSDNICKDVRYSEGSNITFTVEKDKLSNGDKFYVFANILNPELGTGKTLDDYLAVAVPVNGIVDFPTLTLAGTGKTEKCLPMMGIYEVVDKNNLPSLIPVPLESLYAKIAVTINVNPEQKVDGVDPASFTFDSFEVHNVASVVDFIGGTSGVTNDVVTVYNEVFEGQLAPHANNIAQGNRAVSFSFYLPERFLKPAISAQDFEYPFGKISDLDQNEADRYPQRFKPLLVKGRNATFVRILGEFIDHQTHHYKVSYDIYVGKDNFGNFDIERNKQYNNSITIKGVTVSNDMTNDDNTISIDHRVDVLRVDPLIVNLRRETLLDSHFEVRPLRIRKNPAYTGQGANASVKIEVIYKDQAENKWVGLERSFGDGVKKTSSSTYLVDSDLPTNKNNVAGKRRYFTTDLTTNTLGATVEDIPVTEDGECVWIYVDEAKVANAKDGKRAAVIRISYLINGAVYGEPMDYTINQQELFPVTYTDGSTSSNYLIEYHEEYLHDYDSDDLYGQTEYEGMAWGLNGLEFSGKHQAILIGKGGMESFTDNIIDALLDEYNPYYDFYLSRDLNQDNWSTTISGIVHSRAGDHFSEEIVKNPKSGITTLTLVDKPNSAVEYCYNKNKRDSNGNVVMTDGEGWYLPAVDEIEEIVMSKYSGTQYSYARFSDFRNKFYWSCQPAYEYNCVDIKRSAGSRYGIYNNDNTLMARATKVNFIGGDPNDSNNYKSEGSGLQDELGDENDTYKQGSGNILNKHKLTATTMAHRYVYFEYSWGSLSDPEEHGIPDNFSRSCNSDEWNISMIPAVYEHGAKSRTDKARVRCVRKMN